MSDTLPELGGTGLVANLYEYLWTKNNLLQTRCMYHKCPPVLVPDTILLKNKQPISWYFSSLKTGTLQRRSKELSISKVSEALMRRQDPSVDIVSVYVGSAKGDVQPITEYLSPAGMEYFLSTPPSRRTQAGLIQSFIVPKGTSNFIIRVSWTPDECSMDSCININKLADPELEAQDRAATNDDKNCVLIPMAGNVLSTQLERLCGCITEHIHLASSQQFKVISMVINFKIDSEDRVWLLWCEQLEIGDEQGRLLMGAQADTRLLDVSDDEQLERKVKGKEKENKKVANPKGSAIKPHRKPMGKNPLKYAEPEVVDSDEDDFFSAHESNLDQGSSRGHTRDGVEESDESGSLPHIRPISGGSDMDSTDMILAPEGSRKIKKQPSGKTATRKPQPSRTREDSTPRSDISGSSALEEAPRPKKDNKGKEEKRAAERQRELRRTMAEEKKKREEAEQRALEAQEKLKKAEQKAKTAEAKLKKAQQLASSKAAEVESSAGKPEAKGPARTKRVPAEGGTLPRIPPQPVRQLKGAAPQEPLQPVDGEDPEKMERQESTREMATEIAKVADIDDMGAEADPSALEEIKPDDVKAETGDPWADDLPGTVPPPQPKYVDQLTVGDQGEGAGDEESEISERRVESETEEDDGDRAEDETEQEVGVDDEEAEQAPDVSVVIPPATQQGEPMSGAPAVAAAREGGAPLDEASTAAAPPVRQSAFDDDEADYEVVVRDVAPAQQVQTQLYAHEPTKEEDGGDAEVGHKDEGDSEDYEDRPISHAEAIPSDAPAARAEEGDSRPRTSHSSGRPKSKGSVLSSGSADRVQFTVEATERDMAPLPEAPTTAATITPFVDPRREEWETKGLKFVTELEPSPAEVKNQGWRDIGRGSEALPLDRNWDGDEIDRDVRMVNLEGAQAFRSELRVGTGCEKWSAHGLSTVLDGVRIGTTSHAFGAGESGLSVSSMFDNDGLQPPHMQALTQAQVALGNFDGPEDNSQRCAEEPEVTKATPDPIPDFFQPQEEAEQTLEKESILNTINLPVRKAKGQSEKRREMNVEMIYTPMARSMDPDAPENPEEMKADLGLPDSLWACEQYRSEKYDPGADQELMREPRESRFVERATRTKGLAQSQIDTASFYAEVGSVDRGYAPEVPKKCGPSAPLLEAGVRELSQESVNKNSEWAYDEYLRPQARTVVKSKPVMIDEELSEVMEMKFDVAFATDEERQVFAKAQREKLAKLLGIPAHYIDISEVKPGSPVTMIRFNIKNSDAAMIPAPAVRDPESVPADLDFDVPPLGVSMLQTSGEDSHRQLSNRLRDAFEIHNIKVDDRAVVDEPLITAPPEVMDLIKAYSRETSGQVREESHGRSKGESDLTVPGVRFEEPHQLALYSGENESTVSSMQKVKGSLSSLDDDGVDRVYRPGREMMTDDQFSSAKVQRRPPKPSKRLKEAPMAQFGDVEEQVKVPYEEVDNTRRLKELEDELNFLPAQRAAMGPRTAILARKDEGLEDHRFDKLDEYDLRMEEKNKEESSRQPSLKLTKAVEETEYELAQKITGVEDPRTSVPCEPAGLSTGDRRQKKKGKDGEKIHIPAIPEAYMAFGTEGENQRLAPSVVTLEKPGLKVADEKQQLASGKAAPDLLNNTAPDILQLKFDVSFVDEKARMEYAEAQREKLAKLLKIPVDAILIRGAVPGSPITVVTFELAPGIVKRAVEDDALAHNARAFDNPILDVGVTSTVDDAAESLMRKMKIVVGPKVPVSRMSVVPGKSSAPMKDKTVKFGGRAPEKLPAYMRTREELEQGQGRQGGALVSDKEAVDAGMEDKDETRAAEKRAQEADIEDKKPVLAYDRRLPKNAKNKQHLLTRIHTIESTLQRLYGKLEADNELPDIESIEQIMSNTIKQSVYTPDAGVPSDMPPTGTPAQKLAKQNSKAAFNIQTPVKPSGLPRRDEGGEFLDDEDGGEMNEDGEMGEDMGGGVDDAKRRAQLRAERRQRMEERERARSDKMALDVKPRAQPDTPKTPVMDASEDVEDASPDPKQAGPDLSRLKALQFEGVSVEPENIPAVPDDATREDPAETKKAILQLKEQPLEAKSKKKKAATSFGNEDDLGITEEDLANAVANDDSSAWKSVFSKVRHGKRGDVISILDAGCPVDLKDPAGNTLLNIGAQNGHKSVIKLLLRRGAALNTQNHKGQTPLHFCFTYGFTDLGNYLISKGADDTVQNFAGLTCYEGLGD